MAGYDRALYQMYLSRVPMFAACTPDQLDRLAELGDAIAVPDGNTIVSEGDAGESFFVLTSGNLRIERGAREVTTLGHGDYFGELALFDPAPRNATVTAVGQVSLIAMSREAFLGALDQIPAFRDALLHGMARRLHELDARV
jgi:CRP-like cAMP-binding protein